MISFIASPSLRNFVTSYEGTTLVTICALVGLLLFFRASLAVCAIYLDPFGRDLQPLGSRLPPFKGGERIADRNIAQHAARRKLSASPYSLQNIKALDSLIRRKAVGFVQRLIQGVESNRTIDAFEICGLYSFEVICESAFAQEFSKGQNWATINEDALALMKDMANSGFTFVLENVFPWLNTGGLGALLPGSIGKSYKSLANWETRTREMVDHLLESTSEVKDKNLLTPLFDGTDAYLGRKLSHDELVSEAMGLMFAGSGTTSTTLAYLMYALARSPTYQTRLRVEVSEVPEGDIAALQSHPFLNAVIKETFRLYPAIISTLPRVLSEDLQIGPFLVPAGTFIGMQNYVHQRQGDIFHDPDSFLPERWLKSTPEMEAALTPFSIGRRNCIGLNLAWEELYIAIEALARSGIEWKLGAEMTLAEMEMEDSLEKGLTLEEPRTGFGRPKVEFILRAVKALKETGYTSVATRGDRGTIQDYFPFYEEHHFTLPTDYERSLRDFVGEGKDSFRGGAVPLTKEKIQEATAFDYTRLVQTRHSIHHDTGESISPEQIKLAVSRTIHSSRSVNRETRRVYAVYDPVLRDRWLKCQFGNNEFGHKIGTVLVITADIREFDIIGERNQAWIDGGLFAMGMNFALHADNVVVFEPHHHSLNLNLDSDLIIFIDFIFWPGKGKPKSEGVTSLQ
ncbi:hypothetical protein ZTR_09512 [Talaromyces verruculosus]|nr:hypothetical protein ZTR_09512 [Talaromyces verruculosus]